VTKLVEERSLVLLLFGLKEKGNVVSVGAGGEGRSLDQLQHRRRTPPFPSCLVQSVLLLLPVLLQLLIVVLQPKLGGRHTGTDNRMLGQLWVLHADLPTVFNPRLVHRLNIFPPNHL